MQVLWNDEPTNCLQLMRRVRQGDSLSSYLFMFCIERLAHCINYAVQQDLWKPIRLSGNAPLISYLFFVDDMILFAKVFVDQVEVINKCLEILATLQVRNLISKKQGFFFF